MTIIPTHFSTLGVATCPRIISVVRSTICAWLYQNESEYGTELFRQELLHRLVILVTQTNHLRPILQRAEYLRIRLQDVYGRYGQHGDHKEKRWHKGLDEGKLFRIFRTVARILLLDKSGIVRHAVHRQ